MPRARLAIQKISGSLGNPEKKNAGLRFGGFLRFSTLSSLRQAKINWAESEVGAVSRFTRFTCEIGIAWGFSSHFFSGVNWVFLRKPLLMATNLYNLFKPLSFPVSHAHFWLRHRCFLRVSPKPSSLVAFSHSGIGAFLWISPEPSSLRPLRLCFLFCVWTLLVPVAFCMFLYTLDV